MRFPSGAFINLPLSTCPGTAQREKFLISLQSAIPRKIFGTFASTLAIGDFQAPSPPSSNASPPGTSRSASQRGDSLSPGSLQRREEMNDNVGLSGATVIREIYDGECPEETFERELDLALEAGCETIVIEPARLGEETARWIRVGNCLHKFTIIFGLSSICLSVTKHHDSIRLVIPLTIGSVFSAGLYMISWQSDPCCKYRIATITDFSRLPPTLAPRSVFEESFDFVSTQIGYSPTILVRRNHDNRKIVQTTIVSVALALAVIRFYTT